MQQTKENVLLFLNLIAGREYYFFDTNKCIVITKVDLPKQNQRDFGLHSTGKLSHKSLILISFIGNSDRVEL